MGSIGLPWLKRVKEEPVCLLCIEVANAHHVYEAIKYGVDIMWIGVRTSANPLQQEVADAPKGIDIPVLVKNPVNPDLELWIGLSNVSIMPALPSWLHHRGFSTYDKSEFRNHPQWQIPIELRRRFPEIPS